MFFINMCKKTKGRRGALAKMGKTNGNGWKTRVLVDKSLFNRYYE